MARIILEGLSVSTGLALGPLIMAETRPFVEKRYISEDDMAYELAAINGASKKVCDELKKRLETIPDNLSDYRDLIEVQMELARDNKILDGARSRIVARKICAAWALEETINELTGLFKNIPESCVAEGAKDIQAVGQCLREALLGNDQAKPKLKGVLAVAELTPADILGLKKMDMEAIISVEGAAASHASILARSLKIPVVSGITQLFEHAIPGENVIVDGYKGMIILGPGPEDLITYHDAALNYSMLEENIRNYAHEPAVSKDGQRIAILANLGSPSESAKLDACGAEGVGLYRTEYSFFSGKLPSEEDLYGEYAAVLKNIGEKSVVFRTMDIGGDKTLPEIEHIEEANPALGLRGIRFCLHHQKIFKTQLRALMRASAHYNASLMIPMLTCVEELVQTKEIIKNISSQLKQEKISHNQKMPLGIMMETPAAVLVADELLRQCDFISIGTNDLLHYLLAIDRGNRHVSYLHQPLHPAFLRVLKKLVDQAAYFNKSISVCGELSANPCGIVILLGFGIKTLSVIPDYIPFLKHFIAQLDVRECAKIALSACDNFNSDEIRKNLATLLAKTDIEMQGSPLAQTVL